MYGLPFERQPGVAKDDLPITTTEKDTELRYYIYLYGVNMIRFTIR